jgi:hypothetical protein
MFLFYIVFFSFIAVLPAHCYIDPGTGSMLFSVLIGFVSIFFFAVKTALIKIKTLTIWYKKDENTTVSDKEIVIYSEGKQYWNVFRPVLEEFDRRQIPVTFYTSDENDLCFDFKSDFVTTSFIGKGNKAYATLNLLEADILLMTTPGLDVYQLKRSKMVKHYSHILHAPVDATLYRLFSFDYFDSVLLTGDYQAESIRFLEKRRGLPEKQLISIGCTYLDVLKNKLTTLPKKNSSDKRTVLVSPSWGENGLLKKYGINLLKPLAQSGHDIIVRPHPQSSIVEKNMLDDLQKQLSAFSNVRWDFERENIKSMAASDVMISDFSGIIFDYMFLFERPVFYTGYDFDKRAYDASDVPATPWMFTKLEELGIRLEKKDFENIGNIVEKCASDSKLKEKIVQAKNTAWMNQGNAGVKCVDALLDIKEKLTNKNN